MISFNLKAIICFVPAIAIMAMFQEMGDDDLAALSIGPVLVIVDLILRLSSEDQSLILPKSGGTLVIFPVWFIGIIFTMFGIEDVYGVSFWAITGMCVGAGILILIILVAIGSQIPDKEATEKEHAIAPENLAPWRGHTCPSCNSPLEYVEEYGQWYCRNCELYPYAAGGE